MTFDFPTLIAHAARTRPLGAGTIIGSGTVSNKDQDGGPGQAGRGGRPRLFLHRRAAHRRDDPGRRAADPVHALRRPVRIEMKDKAGHSIFGAIEQEVVRYDG